MFFDWAFFSFPIPRCAETETKPKKYSKIQKHLTRPTRKAGDSRVRHSVKTRMLAGYGWCIFRRRSLELIRSVSRTMASGYCWTRINGLQVSARVAYFNGAITKQQQLAADFEFWNGSQVPPPSSAPPYVVMVYMYTRQPPDLAILLLGFCLLSVNEGCLCYFYTLACGGVIVLQV